MLNPALPNGGVSEGGGEVVLQRRDNETCSRGGPVTYAPPGVPTRYGTARCAPLGAIPWSGTETSTHWNGYVDCAVRSGGRVAREVVAAL
ncbi:FAD-dependent oxidoreductase [Streptomyces sp. NPDC087901]|uniref:FAD-dependent oxidoreductase n=1 Tax=Streptomyces sp. NPDC087901 TaxID=3365818 RepID=UPI00380D92EA